MTSQPSNSVSSSFSGIPNCPEVASGIQPEYPDPEEEKQEDEELDDKGEQDEAECYAK